MVHWYYRPKKLQTIGLTLMPKCQKCWRLNMHFYTPEEVEFIKENVMGRGNRELTDLVNAHFGLDLTINQIKACKANRKLNSGLNGRFNPGYVPYNKGKNTGGWEPTLFRKGNMPYNYKPVGTKRVNSDGYLEIKIADPRTWKGKHILLWEAANGPIPKGYAVIFGDGDRQNTTLDNLILVSRRQLLKLNQCNLIQSDAELTRTGVIIADIYGQISDRKRAYS
jgi:hypothetical protein